MAFGNPYVVAKHLLELVRYYILIL